MKQMLCLLLLLSSAWVFAEEECDETPSKIKPLLEVANAAAKSGCPNKAKLVSICNSVSNKIEDKDPNSSYVYEYQRKIYEASCADIEIDSEATMRKKINEMWDKYQKELSCDSSQFNVTNGSILKFAVTKNFTSFLEDAAQVWKVDLNNVDASDGKTVLDYIKSEIEKNKNNATGPILQKYYDLLRKSGAKHKTEL